MDFTTLLNARIKWYNPFPGDVIASELPETDQYAVHWRSSAPIDECGNLLESSYHVAITGNCCDGRPEYTLQILRLNRGYKEHILTVNTNIQISAVSETDYCEEAQKLRHRHLLLDEWGDGPLNYTPNFVIFLDSLIRYFSLPIWSIEEDFNGYDLVYYLQAMRDLDTKCGEDDDPPPPPPPFGDWPRLQFPKLPGWGDDETGGGGIVRIDEPGYPDPQPGDFTLPIPCDTSRKFYVANKRCGNYDPENYQPSNLRVYCLKGWYVHYTMTWEGGSCEDLYSICTRSIGCFAGAVASDRCLGYFSFKGTEPVIGTYDTIDDLPKEEGAVYYYCGDINAPEKPCTTWVIIYMLTATMKSGKKTRWLQAIEVNSSGRPSVVSVDGLPHVASGDGTIQGPLGFAASTWFFYSGKVMNIFCKQ